MDKSNEKSPLPERRQRGKEESCLQIMVFFSKRQPEENRDKESGRFGDGYGEPDSVGAEIYGKQKNGDDFENDRLQDGNDGGNEPVVQCGKESGAVNTEAAEEKREGKQAEAAHGQLIKKAVIADEEAGQQRSAQKCRAHEEKTGGGKNNDALFENILQFLMAPGAVIVTDDGGRAHRVADIDSLEQEGNIHDDAEGRHAICSGDGDETVII